MSLINYYLQNLYELLGTNYLPAGSFHLLTAFSQAMIPIKIPTARHLNPQK